VISIDLSIFGIICFSDADVLWEGISIKRLGKLIHSDGITISRIERNEGRFFDKTLRKINSYLSDELN